MDEKSSNLAAHRVRVNALRDSVSGQSLELLMLNQTIALMQDKEYRRLNNLVGVAIQCEPAVVEMAIQTEFVIPAVNDTFAKLFDVAYI